MLNGESLDEVSDLDDEINDIFATFENMAVSSFKTTTIASGSFCKTDTFITNTTTPSTFTTTHATTTNTNTNANTNTTATAITIATTTTTTYAYATTNTIFTTTAVGNVTTTSISDSSHSATPNIPWITKSAPISTHSEVKTIAVGGAPLMTSTVTKVASPVLSPLSVEITATALDSSLVTNSALELAPSGTSLIFGQNAEHQRWDIVALDDKAESLATEAFEIAVVAVAVDAAMVVSHDEEMDLEVGSTDMRAVSAVMGPETSSDDDDLEDCYEEDEDDLADCYEEDEGDGTSVEGMAYSSSVESLDGVYSESGDFPDVATTTTTTTPTHTTTSTISTATTTPVTTTITTTTTTTTASASAIAIDDEILSTAVLGVEVVMKSIAHERRRLSGDLRYQSDESIPIGTAGSSNLHRGDGVGIKVNNERTRGSRSASNERAKGSKDANNARARSNSSKSVSTERSRHPSECILPANGSTTSRETRSKYGITENRSMRNDRGESDDDCIAVYEGKGSYLSSIRNPSTMSLRERRKKLLEHISKLEEHRRVAEAQAEDKKVQGELDYERRVAMASNTVRKISSATPRIRRSQPAAGNEVRGGPSRSWRSKRERLSKQYWKREEGTDGLRVQRQIQKEQDYKQDEEMTRQNKERRRRGLARVVAQAQADAAARKQFAKEEFAKDIVAHPDDTEELPWYMRKDGVPDNPLFFDISAEVSPKLAEVSPKPAEVSPKPDNVPIAPVKVRTFYAPIVPEKKWRSQPSPVAALSPSPDLPPWPPLNSDDYKKKAVELKEAKTLNVEQRSPQLYLVQHKQAVSWPEQMDFDHKNYQFDFDNHHHHDLEYHKHDHARKHDHDHNLDQTHDGDKQHGYPHPHPPATAPPSQRPVGVIFSRTLDLAPQAQWAHESIRPLLKSREGMWGTQSARARRPLSAVSGSEIPPRVRNAARESATSIGKEMGREPSRSYSQEEDHGRLNASPPTNVVRPSSARSHVRIAASQNSDDVESRTLELPNKFLSVHQWTERGNLLSPIKVSR